MIRLPRHGRHSQRNGGSIAALVVVSSGVHSRCMLAPATCSSLAMAAGLSRRNLPWRTVGGGNWECKRNLDMLPASRRGGGGGDYTSPSLCC
eukprot:5708-Hanusia_phi.AAC.1